jgi:hypothetical protein
VLIIPDLRLQRATERDMKDEADGKLASPQSTPSPPLNSISPEYTPPGWTCTPRTLLRTEEHLNSTVPKKRMSSITQRKDWSMEGVTAGWPE